MNKTASLEIESIIAETLDKNASPSAEEMGQRYAVITKILHQAHIKIQEQEKVIRELEEMATTDIVTGLLNRRGFEKFFAQELSRIHRATSMGAALLLFDLDKFKEINDTCGHLAGDACLKKVAEYLADTVRLVDGAARIGGDELAVLLTNTTPEKARARIDQIKAALANVEVEWEGQTIRFSASVGIENVGNKSTYETCYRQADQDLYGDKKRKKKGCL